MPYPVPGILSAQSSKTASLFPPFLPSAPPPKRIQGSKPLSNNASLIQCTRRTHIHCTGSFRDVRLLAVRLSRLAMVPSLAPSLACVTSTKFCTYCAQGLYFLARLPAPGSPFHDTRLGGCSAWAGLAGRRVLLRCNAAHVLRTILRALQEPIRPVGSWPIPYEVVCRGRKVGVLAVGLDG
jgi:hypothetical protein